MNVSTPNPGCSALGASTEGNVTGGAGSKGMRSIQKPAVRLASF